MTAGARRGEPERVAAVVVGHVVVAGLDPGGWWALVRVGCAGRLVYSPAVKVTVT